MIPVRFLQEFKDYMIGEVGFISDEMAVMLFEKGIVEELDDDELIFLEEDEYEEEDDEEYYG